MIIALVRHGETEWNRQHRWQGRSDVELNDRGRQQAAAAAPVLSDRGWAWMITSPLQRARETGTIIADQLPPMPFDLDDELVEQDFGAAEGMINTEAARRWPDGDFPGKESREVLGARGARAIQQIADRRHGDGIVVAHGGLIRAAIRTLCASEPPRILNGSVSLIRRTPDGWQPMATNVTGDEAPADAGATVVEERERETGAATVPAGEGR